MNLNRAVFLDRDDTLIANNSLPPVPGQAPGDLCDPSRVELLPGAREACHQLARAGFRLIMFSNQGVVARGGGTEQDVVRTNERVIELLEEGWDGDQLLIAGVYFCPFHPNGTVEPYNVEHPWRKPSPGMLLAAAEDHGIDLARSWVIGDADRDMEAGMNAGIPREQYIRIGADVNKAILDAAREVIAHQSCQSGT